LPADSTHTKSNHEALPYWVRLIQDGFVIWVLLGALWGYLAPEMAAPGKTWIPEALAVIMLGMGLTLTGEDLNNLRSAGKPLIIGVVLQYLVMPIGGWLLALALGLPKLLALARIIHERSAFVNNAPTGAASAAPAGFDPAAAAGLKASPERRPANAGGVEARRADIHLCVNNPG